MASFGSRQAGLSEEEAGSLLARFGPNVLAGPRRVHAPTLLLRQFSSPLVLILVGAALLSFGLASVADGLIILTIVVAGGLLGFWQERGAARSIEQLLKTVQLTTVVLRQNQPITIPSQGVVPGDVVVLSAGAHIPADCRVLQEC